MCWNLTTAAAGVAAWYAGQLLGEAYSKRNANKPKSKKDWNPLGDPLGNLPPLGPGGTALAALAGAAAMKSCEKEKWYETDMLSQLSIFPEHYKFTSVDIVSSKQM